MSLFVPSHAACIAARSCLAIGALSLVSATVSAQASHRPFSQLYLAVDVGVQNIIGGSLVNGVDVLQQARRPVVSLSLGGRLQSSFGTVVGAAVGIGLTRGNLTREEPSRGVTVDYHNSRQRHWELTIGQAVGPEKRSLVFGYLSEVTRAFDVLIKRPNGQMPQHDEQGLLRFGLGVEHHVMPGLGLRGSLGTSRADFGGRATNFVPTRPLDLQLGVTFGTRN